MAEMRLDCLAEAGATSFKEESMRTRKNKETDRIIKLFVPIITLTFLSSFKTYMMLLRK